MEANSQFSRKRQVLIFGEPQSQPVKEQLTLLKKETAGVTERDMKIILVGKDMQRFQKYKVEPSATFILVLIGKDGGEKYRSAKPIPPQELFAVIDAMPMRQSEMRRVQQPRQ